MNKNEQSAKGIPFLFAIGFLIVLSSCSYYKPASNSNPTHEQVLNLPNEKKYLILQIGDQVLHMENVRFDSLKNAIICTLRPLDSERLSDYLAVRQKKSFRVREKENALRYKNEIVFFARSYIKLSESNDKSIEAQIPLDSFYKITSFKHDRGREVLQDAGVPASIFALIIVILSNTVEY